jgi:hypothetical protein
LNFSVAAEADVFPKRIFAEWFPEVKSEHLGSMKPYFGAGSPNEHGVSFQFG